MGRLAGRDRTRVPIFQDHRAKKDALIIFGGQEVARLEKSLPDPTEGTNDYDKLKSKLNQHFLPKRNKHHARYKFLSMKPNSASETTLAYFGDNRDERILEHLIQTISNKTLIQKAINKRWNLEQFLTEASQLEDTKIMVNEMRDESHDVAKVTKHRKPDRRPQETREYSKCGKCGQEKHPRAEDCPARGRNCAKCHKRGHYAAVCRSKTRTSQPRHREHREPNRKQVRKASTREDSSTSSDDEFFEHMKRIRNIKNEDEQSKMITLRIIDVDVKIEPDSGADVNIMDEHQFKALVHRSQTKIHLQKSRVKLSTLQSKLPVKGEFKATVRNKTRGVATTIIVVEGRINSPPLIGKSTLTDLGMLKIDPEGALAESNDLKIPENTEKHHIRSVTTDNKQHTNQEIADLLNKHSIVFEGRQQKRRKTVCTIQHEAGCSTDCTETETGSLLLERTTSTMVRARHIRRHL